MNKRTAFIQGVASIGQGMADILSFGKTARIEPSRARIDLAKTNTEAWRRDRAALAGDMEKVGEDMWQAMDKLEAEYPQLKNRPDRHR